MNFDLFFLFGVLTLACEVHAPEHVNGFNISHELSLSTESYSCSLKECLELFTEPETLSENDAW